MDFSNTYRELKGKFSTIWLDQIDHEWRTELASLEEQYWTELQLRGDYLIWTAMTRRIYTRMQHILEEIRERLRTEEEYYETF